MSRETAAYKTPNKLRWGVGPWVNEPDAVAWTDNETGLACCAKRNSSGAWCGYVGVPYWHAFHGVHYSGELRIIRRQQQFADPKPYRYSPEGILEAHGGITFSGRFTDIQGRTLWWFGFDCSHAGDLSPQLNFTVRKHGIEHRDFGEEYRDIAYVKSEATRLANQLNNKWFWEPQNVFQRVYWRFVDWKTHNRVLWRWNMRRLHWTLRWWEKKRAIRVRIAKALFPIWAHPLAYWRAWRKLRKAG